MIRIIRTSTLKKLWDDLDAQERELTKRATRIGQLETEIEDIYSAAAKAREAEADKSAELYVQLGEAAQKIDRLTDELKKVTTDRDDARGDLATIDKAADGGFVRVVPQPRREPTLPPSATEAGTGRGVFDYPHESAEPALVVEQADQGCGQCMEAIRLLSIENMQNAMLVGHHDGLVIAQLLILNELYTRVQSVKPEEGQE
ncbi:hypothetical protein ACF09E_34710 [Streptomyces sp. NPDC014891]|uniref:hypothetical protein n=1 Tax=Streptomyces sp. NPDC014891 TaxID=3364929 RepID=UPI0037029FBA